MKTNDRSDWRLQGQERYLAGAKLTYGPYRRYRENPEWDHDHCEFCAAEFAVGEEPGALRDGYHTLDEYRWICPTCFSDFCVLFRWEVVEVHTKDDA